MLKKLTIVFFLITLWPILSFSAFITGPTVIKLPHDSLGVYKNDEERYLLFIYKVKNSYLEILRKSLKNETVYYRDLDTELAASYVVGENEQGRVDIPFVVPGLYLCVLKDKYGGTEDAVLVTITDLDFMVFVDGRKIHLFAFNTKDGMPVRRAKVYLIDSEGNVLEKAVTDDNGMVVMNEISDNILLEKDGTYAYTRLWRRVSEKPSKLFFITDRPIYRPGHTVHFRGTVIEKESGIFTPLEGRKVSVTIRDPNFNELFLENFETNDFGGFWGDYKLSDTAPVGIYRVEIDVKGVGKFKHSFLVEEYRKPEYKITIETDKNEYISGDVIRYLINVSYFNRQPVVNAEVAYYVYSNPEGFWYDEESKMVYYGVGYTDSNGNIEVPVRIKEGFDGWYSINVIAVDTSQRQVEETKRVRVHADNVSINFDKSFYDIPPGVPSTIHVTITDLKGRPLNGTATVFLNDTIYGKYQVIDGDLFVDLTLEEVDMYRLKVAFGKAKKTAFIYVWSGALGEKWHVRNLMIFRDKDKVKYSVGDEMTITVISPKKMPALLTILGVETYYLKFVHLKEGTNIFKFTIPERIVENNLFFRFYTYERGTYWRKKEFKIPVVPNKKLAEFSVNLDRGKYEPGQKVKIVFNTDTDLDVTITMVDEAIYSMVGQKPPDFERFLYPDLKEPRVEIYSGYRYLPYANIPGGNKERERLLALMKKKKDHMFLSEKDEGVAAKINVREYFPDTALWIPSLPLRAGTPVELVFSLPDTITTWKMGIYGIGREKMAQKFLDVLVTKDFYVRPILPTFFREGDKMEIGAVVNNATDQATKARVWIDLSDGLNLLSERSTEVVIPPHGSVSISWWVGVSGFDEPSTVTIYAAASLKDAVALKVPIKAFAFKREFYRLLILNGSEILRLPDGKKREGYVRSLESLKPIIQDSIKKLIKYPYGCTEQTMSSFFPAVVAKLSGIVVENLGDIVNKGLARLYYYQHYDGGWGWWKTDESDDFMSAYVMEGLFYARKAGYMVSETVIERGIDYLKSNPSAYGEYVLSLYGETSNYNPVDPLDYIFLSLKSMSYTEKALKYVEERSNVAFVNLDTDFFLTKVQMTAILLRALNKWGIEKGLQKRLVNYLLLKKDGVFWYSTKDTSYAVLGLLEVSENLGKSDIRLLKNGDYVSLKPGEKVSIDDKKVIVLDGSGIVEVRMSYFEVPERKVTEGFDIERSFYKRYEVLTETGSETSIVDAFLPMDADYVPLKIREVDFTSSLVKLEMSVLGRTLDVGGRRVTLPEGVRKIYILEDDTYVAEGEDAYYLLSGNTWKKISLIPKGRFLGWENGKLLMYGEVAFTGNTQNILSDGFYEILFREEKVTPKVGDIMKTVVRLKDGVGDFLVLEDFFPSCAQILDRYREKIMYKEESYKFSYYWYYAWKYWYTAMEVHDDRVAFFMYHYTNGKVEYYWRVTASGTFKVLPSRIYPMYTKGFYGSTSSDTLVIGK